MRNLNSDCVILIYGTSRGFGHGFNNSSGGEWGILIDCGYRK